MIMIISIIMSQPVVLVANKTLYLISKISDYGANIMVPNTF